MTKKQNVRAKRPVAVVPTGNGTDHDEEFETDLLLDQVIDEAIGAILGGPDADGPDICAEHAVSQALQKVIGVPDGEGLCKDCLCDIGKLAIERLLRHRLI